MKTSERLRRASVLPALNVVGSAGAGGRGAGVAGTSGGGGSGKFTQAMFVRVQVYAIKGLSERPSGSARGTSASAAGHRRQAKAGIVNILNEATRAVEDGYRHLLAQGLTPKPPNVLHGPPAIELFDWYSLHKSKAEANRAPYVYGRTGTRSTRKQNPTHPTVITEVASFPGRANDSDPVYVEWRRLCVERLRCRYGGNLVSVLEHTDEPHGHLHAIVARQDAKPIRLMHPGHAASAACADDGGTPKHQQAAYIKAMVAFQQDFFEAVGGPSGLKRASPQPVRRETWQQWQANKRAALEQADAVAAIVAQAKEVKEEARQLELRKAGLDQLIADRVARNTGIRTGMQVALQEMLDALQRKLEAREGRLALKEVEQKRLDEEATNALRKSEKTRQMMETLLDVLNEDLDDEVVSSLLSKVMKRARGAAPH